MAFYNYTVPELKAFLKARGIQSTLYRKVQLVQLAETAVKLNFPVTDVDDYRDLSVSRRTVNNRLTQETIIVPEISSIKEWTNNLKSLPSVEMGDIMVYLLNSCGWPSARLKNYKQDNGYLLYMCDHINDLYLCQTTNPYFYVKGTCVPETRQTEKPYNAWVLMDDTGSIQSGGCTCVADDGSCKHCVALLFAIQNFCERHQDRNTEVGTDNICSWDKPRKKSEPSKVVDCNYGKQITVRENYTPKSKEIAKSQRELEKAIFKICKGTNALILQTIEHPSDDSDPDSDIENQPETFLEILNEIKHDNVSHDKDSIIKMISEKHTDEYIHNVEKATIGQSDNDLWFSHRKGRITASISPRVLHCNMNILKPNNYIVRSINGTNIPFSTEATEYGKSMEKVALTLYLPKMKNHPEFEYRDCGLFVSRDFPYLGASPDGIIKCKCCGLGLIEIKTTHIHQHKTAMEIANADNYFIYNDNGKVKLKEDTSWYEQIQTQLGVCALNYCDFVFFTKKGVEVDRIRFDQGIFSRIQEKSELFFKQFFM